MSGGQAGLVDPCCSVVTAGIFCIYFYIYILYKATNILFVAFVSPRHININSGVQEAQCEVLAHSQLHGAGKGGRYLLGLLGFS